MDAAPDIGFVRTEAAPRLPAPPTTVGIVGWLRHNLFSSWWSTVLTLVGLWLVWLIVPGIIDWAILSAVWTGNDRDACLDEKVGREVGACWPFVFAKLGQFIYGRYPESQLWRVNVCYALGAAALVPMMIPTAPYKGVNAIFLLGIYPILTLILLTGGDFDFSASTLASLIVLILFSSIAVPFASFGAEDAIARMRPSLYALGAAVAVWLISWFISAPILIGSATLEAHQIVLLALAGFAAYWAISHTAAAGTTRVLRLWGIAVLILLAVVAILEFDFGLVPVETSLWGGLLVTLVVAITGIVASFPLGILLALGRRSKMPLVRFLSVVFIEFWRGVPLITVLFMASNMLPFFLPEGISFDKLLRALIGVALFSAAYMAEVVRGGLQAIPRGQYEGARAVGLSYWQMTLLIILPQALKIVIPGIVNTFIGLFKDTTLVLIIGLFDFLGMIQLHAGADPNWFTPHTSHTGYAFAALVYFVFCFGMSRYSLFMERRLHTGHRR